MFLQGRKSEQFTNSAKIVSLQMVKIPAKNNWLGFDSIFILTASIAINEYLHY
jgi:hypothetical protein